jgi:TRAP-type C4-dicarboxylate transport system permease small subunit
MSTFHARTWPAWLGRRADDILVLMMLAMFGAFILQIVFRYFMNLPVAWTEEVCVIAWLWGILWGTAFVTRDDEDIRFDMVYGQVSPRTRRVFRAVGSTAFVAIMAWALPATWSYVRFMKVESSAALQIRMDWLFSIYLVFAAAMIVRHLWIVWRAVFGRDAEPAGA